jgi:hypothetical protein
MVKHLMDEQSSSTRPNLKLHETVHSVVDEAVVVDIEAVAAVDSAVAVTIDEAVVAMVAVTIAVVEIGNLWRSVKSCPQT